MSISIRWPWFHYHDFMILKLNSDGISGSVKKQLHGYATCWFCTFLFDFTCFFLSNSHFLLFQGKKLPQKCSHETVKKNRSVEIPRSDRLIEDFLVFCALSKANNRNIPCWEFKQVSKLVSITLRHGINDCFWLALEFQVSYFITEF